MAWGRKNGLFVRKSVDHVRTETQNHGLKRSLGPIDLMFLGVGSTIGAGIYVMTGTAAATFAGPAVLISFVIAGFACAFGFLEQGGEVCFGNAGDFLDQCPVKMLSQHVLDGGGFFLGCLLLGLGDS